MHDFFDGTVLQGGFKRFAGHSFFETDVEFRIGDGVGDIPHFGFGLAAEFTGYRGWRVDLNGEIIAAIENLY